MFDEIDPNSDAFESLKSFCTRIGEGRLQPGKTVAHYILLDHPIIGGEEILVIYDALHHQISLAECLEGAALDWNDPPIFHFWDIRWVDFFPVTAVLDRKGVTLSFLTKMEGATVARWISHHQYQLLKGLFDLENPYPWAEVDERGKPVKLDDTYLPS